MDLATVDHLLTTTRSVRLRLDLTRAVEPEIIERCIEIAIQAPNGGNAGRYHFVVVEEARQRARVAEIYRQAYAEIVGPQRQPPTPADAIAISSDYLAEHLHEVPIHIIACVQGRVENAGPFRQATRYGSILPATWSLMLALRARGLGSAWTTTHILREREVAAVLGIPEDFVQVALLPVAYYLGSEFKPAARLTARQRTYWNAWGHLRPAAGQP